MRSRVRLRTDRPLRSACLSGVMKTVSLGLFKCRSVRLIFVIQYQKPASFDGIDLLYRVGMFIMDRVVRARLFQPGLPGI